MVGVSQENEECPMLASASGGDKFSEGLQNLNLEVEEGEI